ncbi:MAG: putative major pilin subunit [Planctomycetaceae bacterium]|nr:putative major pilin subunit [Planctomycetaceae bacterium]
MNRTESLNRKSTTGPCRAGLSLIEVLVVLTIISILLGVLLPAVLNARSSSRRLQCKSHLRNIAIALISETDNRQKFPASGYFGKFGGDFHNWVVTILPWIDQSVIYDKWDLQQPFNSAANLALGNSVIPVLVCPDDITAAGQGDLSFVVNGGFGWTGPPCGVITPSTYAPIDLSGHGPCVPGVHKKGKPSDFDLLFQTGLMFAENWPKPQIRHKWHNMGSIFDGTSQTIMLAENIHSGYDKTGHHGNWANPLSWRTCFFISGHVCKDFSCIKANVDYTKANDKSDAPYKYESFNVPYQIEGAAPWPASLHAGGVNLAFCDGSVRFVSENLDGRIYVSLVSPQGSLITGALAQVPVDETSF